MIVASGFAHGGTFDLHRLRLQLPLPSVFAPIENILLRQTESTSDQSSELYFDSLQSVFFLTKFDGF